MKTNHAHPQVVREEHISILFEPGSRFYTHLLPNDGSAASIKDRIIEKLNTDGFNINKIHFIGSDGTNVNGGCKNGVIRSTENHIGHPVHWVIRLLHFNELPLRHLFFNLDGIASGPNTLTGPIGNMVKDMDMIKA